MTVDWELCESGPRDAERCVLLLPGGLNSARSYRELMAEPALRGVRLVAATIPGHAGTQPPDDFTMENYARLVGELAARLRSDVLVGFSMGASIAAEVVATGVFSGPVVLLGVSLSTKDEPAFFRAICRLGAVLGSAPSAAMLKMIGMATKQLRVSADRRVELLADLRKNDPKVMRHGLLGYIRFLDRQGSAADRLCAAGVPTWVVHADKGDGGLTAAERQTLQACPHATVVTIPGTSYFLPNEEPERIAEIVADALAHVTS